MQSNPGDLFVSGILKALYFLGVLAEIVLRFPHGLQHRRIRRTVDRVTGLERSLVCLLSVGLFFIPAIYTFTSWLDGADYRLSPSAKG
jgi:hypothetical protein